LRFTVLHLFCGLGGGALGFKRAGFRGVGAFDVDADCCCDFELLVGEPSTVADLGEMTPDELRAQCSGRPDVVFTSPPCKSFSGCLPAATAETEPYLQLSSLALRGVWLVLEAWDPPPSLIVLENVPRIMSRGRHWLDQLSGLLRAYGYAVSETTHDCGELGGLAQHRRRFLLVARHMAQVPEFLYKPPLRRVRGVGEVLGGLPVPLPGASDGLHRLPRMSPLNWLRLALIPAGGDWRDLPKAVALPQRASRHNGPWGVNRWDAGSHTVVAEGTPRNTWCSVQDPRVTCQRREGSLGVRSWTQSSVAVIANGTHHNGPWQVADPRLAHNPRPDSYGVLDWAEPSHCIRAVQKPQNTSDSVADPRVDAELVGEPLDLNGRPCHLVIRALDGTWHRPMTTLELAVLQGFPADLQLVGRSHAAWRQRIGNAVPPPAAEAIARECRTTLEAARGGRLLLSGQPVWVEERV